MDTFTRRVVGSLVASNGSEVSAPVTTVHARICGYETAAIPCRVNGTRKRASLTVRPPYLISQSRNVFNIPRQQLEEGI